VLCGNVLFALNAALRPRGYSVLSSDHRVSFMARTRYVYPDVSATCGALELEANDVLLNPQILVEVLSSSTELYDRGLKWEGYQRLASLTDYVLVSQVEPRIEHFERASDGSWTYRAAETGGRIVLSNGAVLVVDDIFAGAFELEGD
jgi:Uma2 family endonuclease